MINEAAAYRDLERAFNDAIASGILSDIPMKSNYADNYMYMYTQEGKDYFKHIDTREYISAPVNDDIVREVIISGIRFYKNLINHRIYTNKESAHKGK